MENVKSAEEIRRNLHPYYASLTPDALARICSNNDYNCPVKWADRCPFNSKHCYNIKESDWQAALGLESEKPCVKKKEPLHPTDVLKTGCVGLNAPALTSMCNEKDLCPAKSGYVCPFPGRPCGCVKASDWGNVFKENGWSGRTIEPGDAVLGRNASNEPWSLDVYRTVDVKSDTPYVCHYKSYKWIIPYESCRDLLVSKYALEQKAWVEENGCSIGKTVEVTGQEEEDNPWAMGKDKRTIVRTGSKGRVKSIDPELGILVDFSCFFPYTKLKVVKE